MLERNRSASVGSITISSGDTSGRNSHDANRLKRPTRFSCGLKNNSTLRTGCSTRFLAALPGVEPSASYDQCV
jgi:hypothetical protein